MSHRTDFHEPARLLPPEASDLDQQPPLEIIGPGPQPRPEITVPGRQLHLETSEPHHTAAHHWHL